MSDRPSAIRILEDAHRLNMMDGHFVWLWVDTATIITVKNSTASVEEDKESSKDSDRFKRAYEERETDEHGTVEDRKRYRLNDVMGDIRTMQASYFVQSNQFLFFHREDRKWTDRRPRSKGGGSPSIGQLPPGLLSLKPLPVKVDRHVVKGAMRLLIVALKEALDQSTPAMLNDLVRANSDGCWKNTPSKGNMFIQNFAR
ncbi:unnamed protein product [Acanthoscelides obtectus]|uniref:Uncharacterized protein n=1 Tax=Acanthoscelides obtectus TaxID=200917 RepID=A0A9P0KDR8_ACAOB|nr:unnamed protein product [Acanthoscelides obtectus]CAK1646815.1 hypothetical protein AOBTE_LOCUS14869 [Acanthoscelides obtectus]